MNAVRNDSRGDRAWRRRMRSGALDVLREGNFSEEAHQRARDFLKYHMDLKERWAAWERGDDHA